MTGTPWHPADTAEFLLVPGATSHKYSRGVLGVRTGSSAYPGAAVLSVEAAWRSGIGMVSFVSPLDDAPPKFGLPSPAAAILALRPETVFAADTAHQRARCDAWLVGCGTDPAQRSTAEREALLELLSGTTPVVVDAGALDLVVREQATAPTIVTPHLGEFQSLWRLAGLRDLQWKTTGGSHAQDAAERARAASKLAATLGVTVLLKGSRTVVAAPTGMVFVCEPATSWLATAGTGDVLAGVLGALVAIHADAAHSDAGMLARLGAAAVTLHDTAARIASTRPDGCPAADRPAGTPAPPTDSNQAPAGAAEALIGTATTPITALDVAACLPAAHRHLRLLRKSA
ncbi:MAG: NAD(P)H-hydrate dehydratase [Leucobacter sp.]|nr:NAD(P)H-hydrate dehydratase [Leucobacter sp.]